MVTLGKYAVVSFISTASVIYHAFYTRQQFYPAMLYLSTSKMSLVILGNMAFVLTLLFGQLLKTVFLGTLREAEVERLYELSRQEIMETCLAMTIFRDEFNMSFLAMFTALLFIKIFHWLSQKRVEYIETTPTVSRLSHVRIIGFMLLLFIVDCMFLKYAVTHAFHHTVQNRRPSVLVLFAFEYVILASSTVATFLKYALYVADVVMDGQWDNKAVYIFYLELVRDLLHLFVYLVFFLIVFVYYGLPLHLVRDLYETFRNFRARVADFIRYRRITSNLNDRFLDATPEELARGDATCIICREEMATAKKLPCGHLFHIHCLRSWLERQQTCPTCRAPLLGPENEGANQGHAGRQQPQQHGVEGAAGAAQVVNGHVHAAQHVHVLGQYAPGVHGADLQAQMQAAAVAAAHYGAAAMYPPWRQGAPNWYPAVNNFYGQGQQAFQQQQQQQQQHQQQQQQQQHMYHHPLFVQYPMIPQPFLAPMPTPAPPAAGEAAAAGPESQENQAGQVQAGPTNQDTNSFGQPVNFGHLSDAQAQVAARLQMQASLAAAWTAQAQAQLAMTGWTYPGLPYYGMTPAPGVTPHTGAGTNTRTAGEATAGTSSGSTGDRPAGAAAPGNLSQMLMQQYQTLMQMNLQAASAQSLRFAPPPQAPQQEGEAPASIPDSQPLDNAGTQQEPREESSVTGVGTESSAAPGSADADAEEHVEVIDEAERSDRETLRRRRLQKYEGEGGREGGEPEGSLP